MADEEIFTASVAKSFKMKPAYRQKILDELPKDLRLICADGSILVHRCVLIEASSVLRNLLLDKDPAKTSALTFADVGVEQMTKTVELLYQGQTIASEDERDAIRGFLDLPQFTVNQLQMFEENEQDFKRQKVTSSPSGRDESEAVGTSESTDTGKFSVMGARERPIEEVSVDDEADENRTLNGDPEAFRAKSFCMSDVSQNDDMEKLERVRSPGIVDFVTDEKHIQPSIGTESASRDEVEGEITDEGQMEIDCPVFNGEVEEFPYPDLSAYDSTPEENQSDLNEMTSIAPQDKDKETHDEITEVPSASTNYSTVQPSILIRDPYLVDVHSMNDIIFVMNLLKNPCFEIVKSPSQQCAIHIVLNSDKEDLAKFLIETGICMVNEKDGRGNTPLHIAIQRRQSESMIFYLIEKGASLHAVNNEGDTPLFLLLKNVNQNTLKILIRIEENGLRMEDDARDAVIFILSEYYRESGSWLRSSCSNLCITNVLRYFIEKGGTIQSDNHWKAWMMLKLVNCINLPLLIQQEPLRDLNIGNLLSHRDLIAKLWMNNITIEKLLLILLESAQVGKVREFVIHCLLPKMKFAKYFKVHPSVRETLDLGEKLVVIRTLDKDISLNRIKDTQLNVKCFNDNKTFTIKTRHDEIYAFPLKKFTSEMLKQLKLFKEGKFMVVTESIEPGLEKKCKVLQDSIEWDDLSREARWEYGTPGDYQGFRLSEESESLFFQCLRDLSPRKLTGQNCYTFFRFLNGRDLINLMKRRISLTDIMGDLFDECVRTLTEDEIQILENIALELEGENLTESVMDKLVAQNWLTKKDGKFQIRNQFASSYFLARRIFQVQSTLSMVVNKYMFRSRKKQIKISRWLTMNARVFEEDSFVYFLDRLVGKAEQCKLNLSFDEDFMTDLVEACVASNAHNLIRLLSSDAKIKSTSDCVIPILACGTVHLPEQGIAERKQLIQTLVTNGNTSHLNKVDVKNWQINVSSERYAPVSMPLIHLEMIKLLIELGSDVEDNHDGVTFAQRAAEYMPLDQFEQLVQYLIGKGLSSKLFSVSRDNLWNPLQAAEKFFIRRPSIKSALISAGVNLDFQSVKRNSGASCDGRMYRELYTPLEYYDVLLECRKTHW